MCKHKKCINALLKIFVFILCINLGFILNEIFFRDVNIKFNDGHYEECVYITPNGNCYHSQYCSYITEKKQMGLNQAIYNGYKKCEHCNGVSFDYICINGTIILIEQNNYFASFFISFCVCLIPLYILKIKYITNI